MPVSPHHVRGHLLALWVGLALWPAGAGTPNLPAKARAQMFRSEVNLVLVRASVTDRRNRFVPGLEKEHFRVFEDKVEQDIAYFERDAGPVSAGILLDVSGSMRGPFGLARQAVRRFLESGGPGDEFFLATFNEKVSLDLDFTPRTPEVLGRAALRPPAGRTALYDAVYMGLEKIKDARHQRRVLVVISDGGDNSSRYSVKEVEELARESSAQVYLIAPQKGPAEKAAENIVIGHEKSVVQSLADLTGGRAFFPESLNDLDYYIDHIQDELRHQYMLGYHPTNRDHDGRWRRLRVRLSPPEGLTRLAVRAREGYYGQRK